MTRFTLYHLPRCPYCVKVRAVAAALGIELRLVDISRDSNGRQRLLDERARTTVPVLAIQEDGGERLLGESRDIVMFLRTLP